MSKGRSTKREFDWRTYSKPARLLSDEQEAALTDGILAPLLSWVLGAESARMEVRARQAAIYHSGTMLLRIRSAEPPFVGEIDSNVRLPRNERAGAERLETWPLASASDVDEVIGELEKLRAVSNAQEGDVVSERGLLQAFAAANDGRSGAGARYVVADTEYQYGKRRFDFVGMKRAVSVGGTAAFTTPRLVFGQFKSEGRSLGGSSGLVSHAADFAEFAQALGGAHLSSARSELDALVAQKLRLGLIDTEIPFRHFAEDEPEYLLVLAGTHPETAEFDAPLAEMHDKLVARHHRPELLKFVAVGWREGAEASLDLGDDEAMSYREFKQFRKQLRTSDAGAYGSTKG